MPRITDPDWLSQGGITTPGDLAVTGAVGANATLTGTASLPAVTAGDYIELRDMVVAGNNGLYLVTGSPTTSSIDVTKQALTGTVVDPTNEGANASARVFGSNADEKNIYFDTANRLFTFLNGFGSITVLDNEGVVGQACYSAFKLFWKNDNDLIKFPFPMTSITPEQFEFNEWKPVDESDPGNTISTASPSNTRQLLRTAGWSEVDINGFIEKSGFGWVTLGNIDATDNAYGFFDSATGASDIVTAVFDQAVDEFVETVTRTDLSGSGPISITTNNTISRTSGSWVTDGYKVGDYVFLQNCEDAANDGSWLLTGVSATDLTVSGTPLTNNADDTTLLAAIDRRQNVFTARIRVFGKTYDQSTTTDIGVSVLTNQVYRFPLSEATDGPVTDLVTTTLSDLFDDIITTPVAPYNDMAIGYFSTPQTRSGFVPVGGDTPSPGDTQFGVIVECDSGAAGGGPPTAEQIYAFVQATLTETVDINDPNNRITGEAAVTVIGQLAEPLAALASTGNTLFTLGQVSNPGGDGTGVGLDNYDANDTNRITQVDNDGDSRTFPFVASGSINFNSNLSTDPDAIYRMFFTNDDAGDNAGNDFGTIGAITVQDNLTADIAGSVPQNAGGSTQPFTYDYDGNLQRGTGSDGTDAPITIVAIGLSVGQYVIATGTITRNVNQVFALVAALERNYVNA